MEELVEYLGGLSDEQRSEAVRALPKEQRDALITHMLHRVGSLTTAIINNQEHLWFTGELPEGSA